MSRHAPRLKAPAYARDVLAKKQSGQHIGLLVLSVHDWEAGKDLAEKPGVARIVIPDDLPPEGADLSVLAGLDVLVTGEDTPSFWMAVNGAFAWRAATVWVDDASDVLLLTSSPRLSTMRRVSRTRFAAELSSLRETMLLCRDAPYDSPVFDGARSALLNRFVGASQGATCTL